MIDDPARYVQLSLSRIRDYFQFWPTAESSPISNLARVLSFGISLPLMLYGLRLVAARYRPRGHSGRHSKVVLLYLFVVVYSLVHLLSWALIRYRLPVDAVLIRCL